MKTSSTKFVVSLLTLGRIQLRQPGEVRRLSKLVVVLSGIESVGSSVV